MINDEYVSTEKEILEIKMTDREILNESEFYALDDYMINLVNEAHAAQ